MNIRSLLSIKSLRCVLLGVGASFVLMLILSFIASLIVHNSSMLDNSLYLCAIIVEAFAVFGGSYVAARLHGSRGLLLGLICGVVIYLLMFLLGNPGEISLVVKFLYCAVMGMAGGFLGIK